MDLNKIISGEFRFMYSGEKMEKFTLSEFFILNVYGRISDYMVLNGFIGESDYLGWLVVYAGLRW